MLLKFITLNIHTHVKMHKHEDSFGSILINFQYI